MRVMSEEKLQKLAEFIKQYARDNNGESPSLADIMEYMGMVKSTAYRHILELEKRGIISYSGKNTLETPLQKKMHVMSRRIPVVGMIVCGTPDEQEEHISRYLAVPEEWLDGECFLLEAYGDSMADIGVHATLCWSRNQTSQMTGRLSLRLRKKETHSSACITKTASPCCTRKTAATPKSSASFTRKS